MQVQPEGALSASLSQCRSLISRLRITSTPIALQAFIHGPLSQAGKTEARRLQETVAELLAPMLDIITAMPPLQVEALLALACGDVCHVEILSPYL